MRASRALWVVPLVALVLAGCVPVASAPEIEPSPTPLILATPGPRPPYILDVSPEESSVIPLPLYEYSLENVIVGLRSVESGFESTVCVSFDAFPLLQDGDYLVENEDVLERVGVIVDEQAREQYQGCLDGLLLTYKGNPDNPDAVSGGPYSCCWHAPLELGVHQVVFRFRQTSGDIEQYAW
jgi:hypothetical protein